MAARLSHLAVVVAGLTACVPLVGAQDSTAASSGPSVLKGVYTEEQAKKGESTYSKFCVACHEATEHAGDVFEQAWVGHPLYDFFVKIKTTMPDDEPGKLNDQQYTDIVAYMLKLTGYPAGSAVLANDPDQMKAIMVEARPKPSSGAAMFARSWYLPHRTATRSDR